jgi:hypothetical protein
MAHKGHVIKLLNEHIRSQPSTSDEVIAGVGQVILDEWYVSAFCTFDRWATRGRKAEERC